MSVAMIYGHDIAAAALDHCCDSCTALVIAGSRIGWAIVGDEAIAQLMQQHIFIASGYVQESQLRATALLQYVLSTNGMLQACCIAICCLTPCHVLLDSLSCAAQLIVL